MKVIRVNADASTGLMKIYPQNRELMINDMLSRVSFEIKDNGLFELSERKEPATFFNHDKTILEVKVFVLTHHELMQIKGNAEMLQRVAPPEARRYAEQIISILNT